MPERIPLRPFTEEDLPLVDAVSPLLGLQLRYHADYLPENRITAVDGAGRTAGVATLAPLGGWLSGARELPQRCLFSIAAPPEARAALRQALADWCIARTAARAAETGREHRLTLWFESQEAEKIAPWLARGFTAPAVIPVLRYDLAGPLPGDAMPAGFTFREFTRADDLDAYAAAAAVCFPADAESAAALRFNFGGGRFRLFAAMADGRIAGGISLWQVQPGRAATENIFVLPDHRRRGVGRGMIAAALGVCRDDGYTEATLTVEGGNLPALRLYHAIGYRMIGSMTELRYTV